MPPCRLAALPFFTSHVSLQAHTLAIVRQNLRLGTKAIADRVAGRDAGAVVGQALTLLAADLAVEHVVLIAGFPLLGSLGSSSSSASGGAAYQSPISPGQRPSEEPRVGAAAAGDVSLTGPDRDEGRAILQGLDSEDRRADPVAWPVTRKRVLLVVAVQEQAPVRDRSVFIEREAQLPRPLGFVPSTLGPRRIAAWNASTQTSLSSCAARAAPGITIPHHPGQPEPANRPSPRKPPRNPPRKAVKPLPVHLNPPINLAS